MRIRAFVAVAVVSAVVTTAPGEAGAQEPEPILALEEYVLYDDAAQEVTFTLVFDVDPTAAFHNVDSADRQELSWQYWIHTDGILDGDTNSDRIVTGRFINVDDQVLVQDTLPLGTGPGGWGPERGRVGYEVTPESDLFVFRTSVGYELLGDDGRFAYNMITTLFGGTTFRSSGTSLAELPTETVSVVPDNGLDGGDSVDIELSGFTPDTAVAWRQCRVVTVPAGVNCQPPIGTGVTDDTGSLTAPAYRVQRFIYIDDDERWVDCTDPAESCAIAGIDDGGTTAFARIEFAPPPPPPAVRGTISLTPPTVRAPGDAVTVTGTGFRPNTLVDVHQCLADPVHPSDCERPPCLDDVSPCGPQAIVSATTDSSGGFVVEITVAETVVPTNLFRETECFSAPGACVVAAAEAVDFPGTVVSVPVAVTPTVVPFGAQVDEGDDGTHTMNVVVMLSAPSDQAVTVEWATIFESFWTDVAAEPGSDYTAASGVVTFAPGETVQTVPIAINGDLDTELDELVVVSFENPTNARMGGYFGLGFGFVLDDDVLAP